MRDSVGAALSGKLLGEDDEEVRPERIPIENII